MSIDDLGQCVKGRPWVEHRPIYFFFYIARPNFVASATTAGAWGPAPLVRGVVLTPRICSLGLMCYLAQFDGFAAVSPIAELSPENFVPLGLLLVGIVGPKFNHF